MLFARLKKRTTFKVSATCLLDGQACQFQGEQHIFGSGCGCPGEESFLLV